MEQENKNTGFSIFLSVIVWGSLWGLFESTAGYLLHLLLYNTGWFVWYPVACFFLANVYRKTGKCSAVFLTGIFCAAVKLLNLLLPGRIDKVINPAVSIVFEALAMALVIYGINKICREKPKALPLKALTAFIMNTGWRILFLLYLLFLVPSWIREVSIIGDNTKLFSFFIKENLVTSIILCLGYQFKDILFFPIEKLEKSTKPWSALSVKTASALKIGAIFLLFCTNIALEYYL